jgi:hypothetical protein
MSNDGESLKDRAERIRKAGLAVMAAHSFAELKEVWRRLPNATAKPPQSQRALAEAIALQLDDLGDQAPKDLKTFIAEATPLREFGTTAVTITVVPPKGKPGIEATGSTDEPASPKPATSEDTTMQAHASSSSKSKRARPPGSSGKTARSARTAGGKAKTSRAAGASAKQGAKAPGRKADAPREGTMISIVVKMTKDGKGREAIGNAVAKAFPKSTFADEVKNDDYHAVAWYQNQARKRGWLPKLN